jgi:hypothetical protein
MYPGNKGKEQIYSLIEYSANGILAWLLDSVTGDAIWCSSAADSQLQTGPKFLAL